jgi:hypothetical protein
MAAFVERPLPLLFEVSAGNTIQVVPQVLAVGDHTAEEFGYAVFGFEVVGPTLSFEVSATIADDLPHEVISYSLEIVAKDVALGTEKWSKTIAVTGSTTIQVPANHGHYTFRAIKAGYITHTQHFPAVEVTNLSSLSFEFLPEALEDFVVYEKENGDIKVYFPNSSHRCKLYARVDIAEGYRVEYVYVDRAAAAPTGRPVGPLITSECLAIDEQGIPTGTSCGKKVNLYDNVPYGSASDYCATIDLTASNQVHKIEDAYIYTYYGMDCFKPGETQRTYIALTYKDYGPF